MFEKKVNEKDFAKVVTQTVKNYRYVVAIKKELIKMYDELNEVRVKSGLNPVTPTFKTENKTIEQLEKEAEELK